MADRRLHRRFGTGRVFQCQGPGRYVPLTPLGMPLTRAGRPAWIERRRANRALSQPAGWWVIGPPTWEPAAPQHLARDAAQRLDRAIREHDRTTTGLAAP